MLWESEKSRKIEPQRIILVPSIVFLVWMNVVCYLVYFKILHLTLCLKQHPRFGWLIIKETGTKSQKYLYNIGTCMLVFSF